MRNAKDEDGLDTIVVTSGALKDDVIKKFMVCKTMPELKDKLRKMIVFCGSVEYHEDAGDDPIHGKHVFDVISDISLLIPTLNDLIIDLQNSKN